MSEKQDVSMDGDEQVMQCVEAARLRQWQERMQEVICISSACAPLLDEIAGLDPLPLPDHISDWWNETLTPAYYETLVDDVLHYEPPDASDEET